MELAGKNKRSYAVISQEVRADVVNSIQNDKCTIRHVQIYYKMKTSQRLGLKMTSIRSILRVFKSEGRIKKKKSRCQKIQLVVGIRLTIKHPLADLSPLMVETTSYCLNESKELDEKTYKCFSQKMYQKLINQIKGAIHLTRNQQINFTNQGGVLARIQQSIDCLQGQDQQQVIAGQTKAQQQQITCSTQQHNLFQQIQTIRNQQLIRQQAMDQQYRQFLQNQNEQRSLLNHLNYQLYINQQQQLQNQSQSQTQTQTGPKKDDET